LLPAQRTIGIGEVVKITGVDGSFMVMGDDGDESSHGYLEYAPQVATLFSCASPDRHSKSATAWASYSAALVDEPAGCSRVTNIVRRGPIPSV